MRQRGGQECGGGGGQRERGPAGPTVERWGPSGDEARVSLARLTPGPFRLSSAFPHRLHLITITEREEERESEGGRERARVSCSPTPHASNPSRIGGCAESPAARRCLVRPDPPACLPPHLSDRGVAGRVLLLRRFEGSGRFNCGWVCFGKADRLGFASRRIRVRVVGACACSSWAIRGAAGICVRTSVGLRMFCAEEI